MSLLRSRWAILAGIAVAVALAGLLAWTLPSALARDERAATVERLEGRLAAATASTDRAREEEGAVRAEVQALEEDTSAARERLEAAEKARRGLRRELRALRERLSELGG